MSSTAQHTEAELVESREVEQPSMALISAMTKAELDQQITTARAFPRSIKTFKNSCMDMATLDESIAESCLYALLRGGKKIEGPSARFAEIVQSAWGNCRSGGRVIDVEDDFVIAQGVFHDLESNSQVTMEVKRRIVDSKGKRFNIDMIGVTGNAAASIAHRNAVLKGVPKAFWQSIYLAARKTAVGDMQSLAKKRAEAFAWLKTQHVSEDMALAALGVAGVEDVGLDELATLRGAISAVKNGEATIEAAFAPRETSEPKAKPQTDEPKAKNGTKIEEKKPADAGNHPAITEQADLRKVIDQLGFAETLILARVEKGAIEELTQKECIEAITWMKQKVSGLEKESAKRASK